MAHLLTVYVPTEQADAVRDVLAKVGAGRIGKYEACSFSIRGTGRFRPLPGADPADGEVGKLEEAEEEQITVFIPDDVALKDAADAVRAVHPYEEPVLFAQVVDRV